MTFRIWGIDEYARLGQLGSIGYNHVVADLPNGGYVVAFLEGAGLYFQLYSGAGTKVGGPALVASSTSMIKGFDLQVLGDDGNFAISWGEIVDADTSNVKSRIFKADGSALNVGNVVEGFPNNLGSDAPSVIRTDNGGFITLYNDPTDGAGVKLVVQGATGAVLNTHAVSSAHNGRYGDIAKVGPNQYVVSYQVGAMLTHRSVDLTDPAAPVMGIETQIENGKFSDVVGKPDGGYAIIYNTGTNNMTVKARLFTAAGAADGAPIVITADGEDSQDNFEATALRDGRIAVVYSERSRSATGSVTDYGDIYIRIVDTNGALGPALLLNSDAVSDGTRAEVTPSVVEMEDGRLAITWMARYTAKGHVSTTIVDPRIAAVDVDGTIGNDIYAPSEYAGDNLDGGAGIDTLTFQGALAGVAVNLATNSGTAGIAQGDTYLSFENIIGSMFNDTLVGNGGANILQGGAGNDVLVGMGGADVLYGGVGNDTFNVDSADKIVEAAGAGYDTAVTMTSFSIATMPGVERLVLNGTSAASLVGNAEANAIYGNVGSDKLYGNAGNDVLYGKDGSDFVRGDAGNDKLYGGNHNDKLYGSAGNDFVYGEAGNDMLYGEAGNDLLSGSVGNDRLYGGAGKDVLTGGSGRDIFVFNTALNRSTNVDKITDFSVRDDTIWLDNRYMAKLGTGTEVRPGRLNSKYLAFDTAKDANDYLVYVRKTGVLLYDVDGSGSKAAVAIAILKPGLKLTYADFQII